MANTAQTPCMATHFGDGHTHRCVAVICNGLLHQCFYCQRWWNNPSTMMDGDKP